MNSNITNDEQLAEALRNFEEIINLELSITTSAETHDSTIPDIFNNDQSINVPSSAEIHDLFIAIADLPEYLSAETHVTCAFPDLSIYTNLKIISIINNIQPVTIPLSAENITIEYSHK